MSDMSENITSGSLDIDNAQLALSRPVPIDRRLLEILVCPLTKLTLSYDEAAQELIAKAAYLAYPIRDGIPILLPDEARKIDR